MAVVVWCLLVVLAMCLYSRYAHGLQKFDGPFLASLTDFWRLFYSYRGTLFPMRDLHERYGSVVRYGPNTLTFSDPQAVKDIFGAGKNWDKVNSMLYSLIRYTQLYQLANSCAAS